MNRRLISLFLVASALVSLFAVSTALGQSASVGPPVANVANPSFEEGAGGKPAGWESSAWGGKAIYEYAATGRTGDHCVSISSAAGADAAWHAKVPVEPQATYRLSGWIKTENVKPAGGAGALLNLHDIQPVATNAVTGTSPWTEVQVVFETGDRDSVEINCLLGGWGLATGKAWYDDIRLQKISMANWQPTIAIDAAKVGQPISKYVYGQFIEHLGRCIYGGIWAEMLEDRKFYYAVGDKESPWKSLDESPVAMVREDAFVGEQTPQDRRGQRPAAERAGCAPGQGLRGLRLAEGRRSARLGAGLADVATGQDGRRSADHRDRRRAGPIHEISAEVHRRRGQRRRHAGDQGQRGRVLRRHRLADAGRQRPRHAGRHAGPAARNSIRPSIAGRAAISSAATTGRTASAIATAVRRGRTRPGRASNTTTSAWTSSCSSAAC